MEATAWDTLFRMWFSMIKYLVISKLNQQMEVLFLGEFGLWLHPYEHEHTAKVYAYVFSRYIG